jgi:hypothetical protein
VEAIEQQSPTAVGQRLEDAIGVGHLHAAGICK